MKRVRLMADVDVELRRRVKIAAASSDRTVSEWVEEAVRHELERERETELDRDQELTMPPAGVKPRGSKNPPRLRGGGTMAEAVIEDRR